MTLLNQTVALSFRGVSREIPCGRNGNNQTQIIIKNCRRSPLLSFPFREIPTVTSFPRNDKLFRRMRRLIMFICFKPKRTPVPPCHCEQRRSRSVAIALARRGGTKCRKNSPQVTVFSQSGPTCCERGGKTYLRTRTKTLSVGDFSVAFGLSSSLRSK